MVTLESKFTAGILGSAIGDAIGELAFRRDFRKSLETFTDTLKTWPRYDYTDDTAMAIGIMESLIANDGGILEPHLGDTFSRNYDREPYRGYASGPPDIFATVKEKQILYSEAAKQLFQGSGSFGNGAAMRIAPLAVFFHDHPNLSSRVYESAIVTHAHKFAIDGAQILAHAIAQAMQMDPQKEFSQSKFLDDLIALAQTDMFRNKLIMVKNFIAQKTAPIEVGRKLILTVATHESVPFAIYSFVANYQSFQDCLYCSALNGGDRDTMGAMACAISGAYLGLEGIPITWVQRLENKDYICSLIGQLWKIKQAKFASKTSPTE